MARKPRIDYPGAWHHVMNRGAAGQAIFRDDEDRSLFLSLVGEACERFGIEIHSYVFMGNHYHLLLRSPDGHLSEAMKFISQVYTQRFNRRHGRDGALFRGRFHSILVTTNSHLERVSRYIHRNPLVALILNGKQLESYRWSSFPAFITRVVKPTWLTTEVIRPGITTLSSFYRSVVDEIDIEWLGGHDIATGSTLPGVAAYGRSRR